MAKNGKHIKKSPAATSTEDIVVAIRQIQEMSGKRARFVLTALVVGEHVPVESFRRATAMADHPVAIEEVATVPNPFGDLIQ
jgi:hypothetical protein